MQLFYTQVGLVQFNWIQDSDYSSNSKNGSSLVTLYKSEISPVTLYKSEILTYILVKSSNRPRLFLSIF